MERDGRGRYLGKEEEGMKGETTYWRERSSATGNRTRPDKGLGSLSRLDPPPPPLLRQRQYLERRPVEIKRQLL